MPRAWSWHEDDHDTWSVGSFFTNPVLAAAEASELPGDAPRFRQPDGMVKTSAAWLIEHAGFAKGYGHGAARLSDKHTLALTNRGRSHLSGSAEFGTRDPSWRAGEVWHPVSP